MTPSVGLHWLQRGSLLLGILILSWWATTALESSDFQAAESDKLEAALHEPEASPSEATGQNAGLYGPAGPADSLSKPATEPQGVLGRIEIPRLRITAIVAEGVDAKTLGRAVGHIPSTALPGTPGNCALAGHRDTFLRGLGGVRTNDLIRLVTLDGTHSYRVEWSAVVEPRRVDVLESTATRSLTLVTCYPFAFVGHAPQRFVVRASQVEATEGAMQGHTGSTPNDATASPRLEKSYPHPR